MTVFALKMIAVISMVIDHIGMIFIPRDMLLYDVFRGVGRLAFPIFAFLLVEGFLHTKNIKKYILRMLFFAAISEIPFDSFTSNRIINMGHQNVIVLLALGLVMLFFVNKWKNPILHLFFVAIASGISMILRVDYSLWGIILIYWFYCSRNMRWGKTIGVALIYIYRGGLYLCSILAMIPILFYKGEQGPRAKWVFGIFYPLHLAILYVIAYAIYLLP